MVQNMARPSARAIIKGSKEFGSIRGKVLFYQRPGFVDIVADISGLPGNVSAFYGFHIHEGDSCRGEGFPATGGHDNPTNKPHPYHAGDLPPLLSYAGKAYMQVRTDRFRVRDIIGKTVVIHGSTDDFRSQPSGDSGTKIACGVIQKV